MELEKSKDEATRTANLEKSQIFLEKLHQLERGTSNFNTLAQAKETIWMYILDSMN